MKEITITLDISQVPILVDIILSLPNADEILREILHQCSNPKPAIPHITRREREWLDQPLGEVPDSVIAQTMGVSRQCVHKVRNKLNIPSHQETVSVVIDWDTQPLGKTTDSDLARQLKVSLTKIFIERGKRGIKPFKLYDWDNIPLGTIQDSKISKLTGATIGTIQNARKKRGIPAFVQPSNIKWDEQPLGQISDNDLANQLGVSSSLISYHRHKRGILSTFQAHHNIDWDSQLLGIIPDNELSQKLNVTSTTISKKRKERCIPVYKKPKISKNLQIPSKSSKTLVEKDAFLRSILSK